MFALLIACTQDYTVIGDKEQAGTYNPPDPPVKEQVDEITQVTIPSVDVLWIVDNSGSMIEEQTALRDNFGDFMRYFTDSGMDYHVGVVSTDMDNAAQAGKLILDNSGNDRYIDSSMSAAEALTSFRERAGLGTNGSSGERPKDAAFAAFNSQTNTNQGFYREDASLSIIVISDEQDTGLTHSHITVTEFSNWMLGLKAGTDATVSFSSIVGLTRNDCGSTEQGLGLLEVTDQVGGIKWSICTNDWSGLLSELGLQASGLKREFFLSLAPVEDSIDVTVDDPEFGSRDTWSYDPARNSITFDAYIPPPLTTVSISYMPLATAVEDDGAE
jgi:hypothetical protein